MNLKFKKILLLPIFAFAIFLSWTIFTNVASAASLNISPGSGTYKVGDTFEVSVLLNTQNQEVNAVQMELAFPPDKLQLVSPSTGTSIISIYTTPPKYDNAKGVVQIIGGIPNGVNVPSGLVTKLIFRVKSLGQATIRFTGQSQVLLNDGKGTNALNNSNGATFKLELPAQAGPIVISDSHPDQETWYKNQAVTLQWDLDLPAANGYSYSMSDNPSDEPDDSIDSTDTKITYKKVPDGINYFHIKAMRGGKFGGVSHYAVKIDSSAPALFPVQISPSDHTFITSPFVQFSTTDTLSGLDRYEIKVIPLKIEGRPKAAEGDQLFIESQSPYQIPNLLNGTYEVVVRAYDKAGNIQEVNHKLYITDSWFWFLSQDGVTLPGGKQVSWSWSVGILLFLLMILIIGSYYVRKWYRRTHHQVVNNHLPDAIAAQLTELQTYRERYGKLAAVLLLVIGLSLFSKSTIVNAQQVTPPVISSYSANIKDDELFYVSGRTTEPNSTIVVHLQSLVDGSSFDFNTQADKLGDWTYRSSDFLAGGRYIVWAHTKLGDQLSTPSPQVELDVKPVAINWGNSRITYQTIYITFIAILALLLFALTAYIIIHAILLRKRKKVFANNLRQAEDSIKRGFLALRRDIEAELLLIRKAGLNAELSGEQKVREQQLSDDLRNIENLVGKEIWQLETFEKLPSN